eukprot:13039502-Alexandrium_andersonii.AAC.1
MPFRHHRPAAPRRPGRGRPRLPGRSRPGGKTGGPPRLGPRRQARGWATARWRLERPGAQLRRPGACRPGQGPWPLGCNWLHRPGGP